MCMCVGVCVFFLRRCGTGGLHVRVLGMVENGWRDEWRVRVYEYRAGGIVEDVGLVLREAFRCLYCTHEGVERRKCLLVREGERGANACT